MFRVHCIGAIVDGKDYEGEGEKARSVEKMGSVAVVPETSFECVISNERQTNIQFTRQHFVFYRLSHIFFFIIFKGIISRKILMIRIKKYINVDCELFLIMLLTNRRLEKA